MKRLILLSNVSKMKKNMIILLMLFCCSSRWDRYLGMTAVMTQVPVPTAI